MAILLIFFCRHVKNQPSTERDKLMKDDAYTKVFLTFYSTDKLLIVPVEATVTQKHCCSCGVPLVAIYQCYVPFSELVNQS